MDNNIGKKWENFKAVIKETKHLLIEKDEGTEILKINGTMRDANLQ